MFTGIITKLGRVVSVFQQEEGIRLELSIPQMNFVSGESIAVNGCCLTALQDGDVFFADVSFESLAKTNLNSLVEGDIVNIEPALKVGERMGGHWLSGHVDRTAVIEALEPRGDYHQLVVSGFNEEEQNYLLPKGSISIDGVSLTINEVTDLRCQCVIIPHTLKHTNLFSRAVGCLVNIEFDYVTRVLYHQSKVANSQFRERSGCRG